MNNALFTEAGINTLVARLEVAAMFQPEDKLELTTLGDTTSPDFAPTEQGFELAITVGER